MGYATENFSKRLKEIRETAHLTQTQLANELGVSRGAISYYENGDRTPDIEFIDKLFQYFGGTLPVEFILGYTSNIKVEHKNMYEYYGLTDAACEKLDQDTDLGNLISAILGHKDFWLLKKLYYEIIKNYKDFDHSQLGYLSFLVSDSLNHIIYNALEVLLAIQFTEDERKALSIEQEKSHKEFLIRRKQEKLKEKEREERAKKEDEEFDKKYAEENAVRINAINEVQKKFYSDLTIVELRRYRH